MNNVDSNEGETSQHTDGQHRSKNINIMNDKSVDKSPLHATKRFLVMFLNTNPLQSVEIPYLIENKQRLQIKF